MTILDIVLGIAVLAATARFALSTLIGGRWRTRSRMALIGAFTDAAVVLLLARLLLAWSVLTPWTWFLPVALVSAGVAGAVLRWRDLPIWRADRARWRAIVPQVLRVAVVIVVAGLVFWP